MSTWKKSLPRAPPVWVRRNSDHHGVEPDPAITKNKAGWRQSEGGLRSGLLWEDDDLVGFGPEQSDDRPELTKW